MRNGHLTFRVHSTLRLPSLWSYDGARHLIQHEGENGKSMSGILGVCVWSKLNANLKRVSEIGHLGAPTSDTIRIWPPCRRPSLLSSPIEAAIPAHRRPQRRQTTALVPTGVLPYNSQARKPPSCFIPRIHTPAAPGRTMASANDPWPKLPGSGSVPGAGIAAWPRQQPNKPSFTESRPFRLRLHDIGELVFRCRHRRGSVRGFNI